MSPQAENLGFKASSVAGLIVTIIMGLSGMIAMHQAGIKSANEYTDKEVRAAKEYTDLKTSPIEDNVNELKKKIEELQRK